MYNINHFDGIVTGTSVVIFLVEMLVWEENQKFGIKGSRASGS